MHLNERTFDAAVEALHAGGAVQINRLAEHRARLAEESDRLTEEWPATSA